MVVRASGKVRQLDVECEKDAATGAESGIVTLSTANNLVEVFALADLGSRDAAAKTSEPTQLRKLDISGHRSDVRTVSFSSDNTAILSASHEAVKIWNRYYLCIALI